MTRLSEMHLDDPSSILTADRQCMQTSQIRLRRTHSKEEYFMNSRNDSIQRVVIGGLLAAVVFVATCLSFPNGAGGYTHLGDAMIVLTVMFIGGKRGALSAGIGGPRAR